MRQTSVFEYAVVHYSGNAPWPSISNKKHMPDHNGKIFHLRVGNLEYYTLRQSEN